MATPTNLRFTASATRTTILQATTTNSLRRSFHQSTLLTRLSSEKTASNEESSTKSEHKPTKTGNGSPQPKISNLSIPGIDETKHMTEEQLEDVRKHNRDFENKYDHSHSSAEVKADKKFWTESGGGSKE